MRRGKALSKAKREDRKPLEYYLSLRYPIQLVPEEDGGYTVLVPDLPGCVTVGDTLEEALRNIEEARELWIETAYEYGDEIPLPSTEREYSGKVLLRMPKSLHQRLAESAEAEGVSLNQYLVSLLAERDALQNLRRDLEDLRAELEELRQEVNSWSVRFEGSGWRSPRVYGGMKYAQSA